MVYLAGQAMGIRGEAFFFLGWDPMNIGGFVSFRQGDMGEKPVVRADTGDKICFHVPDFVARCR